MDWNVTYEERYHLTRQAFLEHIETAEGPHLITRGTLARLYYTKEYGDIPPTNGRTFRDITAPVSDVIEMFDPIFRKLVIELCPFTLEYVGDIEERIAEIDDNSDYIYAYCSMLLLPSSQFVRISNETIAVMLKIAE